VRPHVRRGQAAALHANTVTDLQTRRVEMVADQQTYVAAAWGGALDAADILNDPGEHAFRSL
jgi:hypothetical protein